MVRRFIDEAQTSPHLDVIDEIVAPDFVNHTRPATPDRAGLKAIHVPVFSAFPDLEVTVQAMLAEGDLVAVRKMVHGTHEGELAGIPPTGQQVTLSVIEIWRIRDGKIVEHWSEGGAERELFEQLGAGATPEPSGD